MPNIDWKWFIIGALFAMFVWPFITSALSRKKATQPANS